MLKPLRSGRRSPQRVGPWQRQSSQLVYDNPWIRLYHQQVITPAGTPGIYGKISFKNRALGIIPVDDAGHTWLVGQHRYTLDQFSWEIPMGGGSFAISPQLAAERELAEETGLRADQWHQLLQLHTSNSVTDEVGYVFLARQLVVGEQQLEASESDLQLRRLPFVEAVAMALNGAITDAISIAGLLAAERFLVAETP